jgi:murein DD-endopeptidase MepM/ murein hydrolase activator NlpD
MYRGLRPVAWMLSVGAVLLAVASTAHVARSPGAPAPAGSAPAVDRADIDLAAAIRDNAPLPVLLTDASGSPSVPASTPEPTADDMRLIEGSVEDVLYGPPEADPLRRAAVAQALKLFAHRLDVTRDIALGDRVRLMVAPAGPATSAAPLDYAEFDGASVHVRLYRGGASDGREAGYVDETGVPLDRFLLRTPLAATRITSEFGPRLHPLLGYTRMHRGVDFGAASGTPVLAAADGVVAAAGWDGGYGRRILLRHADSVETLYAHLSRVGPSVVASAAVRQGQVIGWTGESGRVTGPHLHFEVRLRGVAVNPSLARPSTPMLSRTERLAFEIRRQAIARMLAACGARDGAGRCV